MSLRAAFFRFIANYSKAQVATHKTTLGAWNTEVSVMPLRRVDKIELCTADTSGKDKWGDDVDDYDTHTLLQVYLEPTPDRPQEAEVVLIERMESSEGIYHSVVPIPDNYIGTMGGSSLYPDIIDRVCIVPLTSAHHDARNLNVERTLEFKGSTMAVQELALILDFVSSMTSMGRVGGDCEYLARSFAFNCLAALAPTLPPPTSNSTVGRAYDNIFERRAKSLMDQLPRMVCDDESQIAVELIQEKRKKSSVHLD